MFYTTSYDAMAGIEESRRHFNELRFQREQEKRQGTFNTVYRLIGLGKSAWDTYKDQKKVEEMAGKFGMEQVEGSGGLFGQPKFKFADTKKFGAGEYGSDFVRSLGMYEEYEKMKGAFEAYSGVAGGNSNVGNPPDVSGGTSMGGDY